MNSKRTKLNTVCPVELFFEGDRVMLVDNIEMGWLVQTKAGLNLSEVQFQSIVDRNLGFYDIAYEFKLSIGEVVAK